MLLPLTLLFLLTTTAGQAQDRPQAPGHGPLSRGGFSHQFSSRAHTPQQLQLSFHFGLLQPLLSKGFNAAVDVRKGRFIATYSHGHGLDLTDLGPEDQRDAGIETRLPWTTGGGVGMVLIDELYALIDVKVHAVDVDHDGQGFDYHTLTIGGELGYRLFLFKGLHIAPVLRYWPTVWSSLASGGREVGNSQVRHKPVDMGVKGLFANVLIGWAFEP